MFSRAFSAAGRVPVSGLAAFVVFGSLGAFWVFAFALWFSDNPRDKPSVNQAELDLLKNNAARLSWQDLIGSKTVLLLPLSTSPSASPGIF